jgi:CBS domain-containing protein
MKVKELMTENLAYATVGTSLPDVARMMMEFDCGCLPVIDDERNQKPIGVITDRDITIRTVAHHKDPLNMVAGEVMTDQIITVTPDMNIEECLSKMEGNQIRRVVVVNEDGMLCGMVAQADIARHAAATKTAELVKDVSMTANS